VRVGVSHAEAACETGPESDRTRMEDGTVAEEPVFAPDQLKPGNRKWGRRGAIASAAILLLFFWGNQEGNTEKIFLVVIALSLVGAVILDTVLRRNGLKPNDQ
jgi:uncharacterized protein DUF2631